MDGKLDRMLKKQMHGNQLNLQQNNNFSNQVTSININKENDLKVCLNSIKRQTNDILELMIIYNENMQSHKNTKENKATAIKVLYNNIKKIFKKLRRFSQTRTFEHLNKIQQIDPIGSLEKRIHEISRILDKKSQAIHEESQLISEFINKLAKNFTKQMQVIEETNSKDLETNNKIENRIFELERKLIATKLRGLENSVDKPHKSNKLDYLEARLNSMTKQSKISLKRLLEIIDKLEVRLGTVKDQINKSYENAKKCSLNCDWGELPSIKELQARLKTLKSNFKTKSKNVLVKSVRAHPGL